MRLHSQWHVLLRRMQPICPAYFPNLDLVSPGMFLVPPVLDLVLPVMGVASPVQACREPALPILTIL